MTYKEAKIKLNECIKIMEDKNSIMSYAAIITLNHTKKEYGVEYGTFTKKLGVFNNKFRDFISITNEKQTTSPNARLLSAMRERIRPIKAGTSICEIASVFKSGTLGILFDIVEDTSVYGLTNMHVASSYLSSGEAPDIPITQTHQNIVQPSRIDRKKMFYPRSFDKPIGKTTWKSFTTLVDAAVIKFDKKIEHTKGFFNSSIKNISPHNYGNLKNAIGCQKVGRTTGYTQGKILSTNAAIRVKNPFNKINKLGDFIVFEDQIMTDNIADPGDSGSVLMSDYQVIGLTFADINFINQSKLLGDNTGTQSTGRTFHNKITNVINAMEFLSDDGTKFKPTFNKFFV